MKRIDFWNLITSEEKDSNIPVQICFGEVLPVKLENMLTKHIVQLRSREQQLGSTLDVNLLEIGRHSRLHLQSCCVDRK